MNTRGQDPATALRRRTFRAMNTTVQTLVQGSVEADATGAVLAARAGGAVRPVRDKRLGNHSPFDIGTCTLFPGGHGRRGSTLT